MWWPLKGPLVWVCFWLCCVEMESLLGRSVFGHSLCSLRHGVFGEFSREQKSDGGLDLARSDGGSLVVMRQTRWLGSNPLKHVIDERIHDWHGLGRNSSVRMNLFQDLVDVDCVRLLPLVPPLLPISLGNVLLGLPGLLRRFSSCLWWHRLFRSQFQFSLYLLKCKERVMRMELRDFSFYSPSLLTFSF